MNLNPTTSCPPHHQRDSQMLPSTMATPFSNTITLSLPLFRSILVSGISFVFLPSTKRRDSVKSRPMPITNEMQIAPSQYKQFIITLLFHLRCFVSSLGISLERIGLQELSCVASLWWRKVRREASNHRRVDTCSSGSCDD